MDVHHITDRKEMPNGGYVKENGITVCRPCHLDCEQFHITGGTRWVKGRHPSDLYDLIDSSKALARNFSVALGMLAKFKDLPRAED